MKKSLFISLLILLFNFSAVLAQDSNTIEATQASLLKKARILTKTALIKTKSYLGSSDAQDKAASSIFLNFYKTKLTLEELRVKEPQNEKITPELYNNISSRDEKLSKLFSPDLLKTWKAFVEPAMIIEENK
jgi:hypothetical protein